MNVETYDSEEIEVVSMKCEATVAGMNTRYV